jgi:hypothetical protein
MEYGVSAFPLPGYRKRIGRKVLAKIKREFAEQLGFIPSNSKDKKLIQDLEDILLK